MSGLKRSGPIAIIRAGRCHRRVRYAARLRSPRARLRIGMIATGSSAPSAAEDPLPHRDAAEIGGLVVGGQPVPTLKELLGQEQSALELLAEQCVVTPAPSGRISH